MEAFFNLVRELVQKNRTEEALDEISNVVSIDFNEDLYNTLSILKSRFQKNKQSNLIGEIAESSYNRELISINKSVLEFIKKLDNEIAERKSSIQNYISSTGQISKEIEEFKENYFVLPKTQLYKNILTYGLLLLTLGAAISYGMMWFNSSSTDWKNLSLENTWKNYNSEDFYFGASVRKEKNYVCLRGLIDGGDVGQNIFTLPVGITPNRGFISLDNICFYVDK